MSVSFDLAIMIIFVVCIFLGYKRGLVNLAIKVLAFVLSLAISLILFRPIANIVIENTNFHTNIKNSIITFLRNNEETEDTKDYQNQSIIEKYITSSVEKATKDATENVIEAASDSIAREIINIVVLIILFVVLRILLIFIKFIANSITELPIIKQFNKSGGVIYGILEALLIIYVVFVGIALLGKGSSLEQAIINSYLASLFYNNNLIFILFLK